MFAKVPVRFATYVRKPRSVLAGGEHYLIYPTHAYRAYVFRAEGSIPVIGDRSAPLPYHYSVADGALFIILIKTTIIHFSFSSDALDLGHKLNSITCNIDIRAQKVLHV